MITNTHKLLIAILVVLFQTGCSVHQVFATGEAYQREGCLRILDNLQRKHCMSQISTDYLEYERERSAISH